MISIRECLVKDMTSAVVLVTERIMCDFKALEVITAVIVTMNSAYHLD